MNNVIVILLLNIVIVMILLLSFCGCVPVRVHSRVRAPGCVWRGGGSGRAGGGE